MKIFHLSEYGRPALMLEFENEQRATVRIMQNGKIAILHNGRT